MVDVKSITLNSIRAGSTVDKPNIDLIINAVSTILHSQLIEDQGNVKVIPKESELFFFSEEKYILEKPEAFDE